MSKRLLGSFLILATLIAAYLVAGAPWTLARVWDTFQNAVEGSTPITLKRGELRGNLFTGVEVRDLRASGLGQRLEVPLLRIYIDWASLLSGPPRIDATLESPVATVDPDALHQPLTGVATTAPDGASLPARPGRLTVVRGRVDLVGGELPLPRIAILDVNLSLRPLGSGLIASGAFAARALDRTATVGLEARFDETLTTYEVTVRGLPAVWAAAAGAEATFGQLHIHDGLLDVIAREGPGGLGVEASLRDVALTYVIGLPLERGTGRITWSGGPVQAEIEGLVNGSPATVRATIDTAAQRFDVTGETVTDLAAAMRLWSLPLPAAGTARVEVAVSGWERVRVEGRVSGVDATFLNLPVEDLDAAFEVLVPHGEPGDDKVFYRATATYLNGAVTAHGEALPDWWVEIAFDEAAAGPATLTGTARIEDRGEGVTIAAQTGIEGPDFWPLQGVATISPGAWPPIAEVRLGLGGGSLDATVTLDDFGPAGAWRATNLPAPDPFSATLNGAGGITGPYDTVEVTAQLTSTPVLVAGFATPPLAGAITGVFSGAERVRVAADMGRLAFEGTAHLADQRWDLTGSLDEARLPDPWTGRIAGRELALTGTFAAPVLSGLATGSGIALAGVELPDLEGPASLDVAAGPRLTFDSAALDLDLAFDTWSGTLRPDLTLSTPVGPLRARGALTGSPAEARGELTLAGPAGLATVTGRGGPLLIAGRIDSNHLSGGWLAGLLPIEGGMSEGILHLVAAGSLSIPAAGATGAASLRLTGPPGALELSATLESGTGRVELDAGPAGTNFRGHRFPVNPFGFPGVLHGDLALAPGAPATAAAGWIHLQGEAAGVPLELVMTGESGRARVTGSLGAWPLSGALDLTGPHSLPVGEVLIATPDRPSSVNFGSPPGGYRVEYSGSLPDLTAGPVTIPGGPAAASWTPGEATALTADAYGISLRVLAGGRIEADVRADLRVLGRTVRASGAATGDGLSAALDVHLAGAGLEGARLIGTLARPDLEIDRIDLAAWTLPAIPEGLVAGQALLLASADLLAPGGPELTFAASIVNARLSGAPVVLDATGGVDPRDWWGSLRVAGGGGRLIVQREAGGARLRVIAQEADLAWFGALAELEGRASGTLEIGARGATQSELTARFELADLAAGEATLRGQGHRLGATVTGQALGGELNAQASWDLNAALQPIAADLAITLDGARSGALLEGASGTISADLALNGPGWLPGGTGSLHTSGAGLGPLLVPDRKVTVEVTSTSPLELAGDGIRVAGGEWSVAWPAELGGAGAMLRAVSGAGRTEISLDAPGVGRARVVAEASAWQADGQILAWERLGVPGAITGAAEFSARGTGGEVRANAHLQGGGLAGEPLELALDVEGGAAGWLWQLRGTLNGNPLAATAQGPDLIPRRVTTAANRLPAGPLATLAGLEGFTGEVSFATAFDLRADGPSGWRGWLDLEAAGEGFSARGRADADGSFATATLEIGVAGVTTTVTGALWPEVRMAGPVSGAISGRATLIATALGNELAIAGSAAGRPLDLNLAMDAGLSSGRLTLNWGTLVAEVSARAADAWRPAGSIFLGDAGQLGGFASGGVHLSAGWSAGEWAAVITGRDLRLGGTPAALRGELTWPGGALEGALRVAYANGAAEVSGRLLPETQVEARATGLPLSWFAGVSGAFDGSAWFDGETLSARGHLAGLDFDLPDLRLEYANGPAGQSLRLAGDAVDAWAVTTPGTPEHLLEPLRGGLSLTRDLALPGDGHAAVDGILEYSADTGTGRWSGALSALICRAAGDPRAECVDASLIGRNGTLELNALVAHTPLGVVDLNGILGGGLDDPHVEGRLGVDALGSGPFRANLGGAGARLLSPGAELDFEVAFASAEWTALWRGQHGQPPVLGILVPGATGALTGQITARGRLDPDAAISTLDARVTGNLSLAGLEFELRAGEVRFEAGAITASSLRLAIAGVPVSLDGRTPAPDGLRLAVESAPLDHLGLPGTLTLGGRISGSLANPRIEAGGQLSGAFGSISAGATGPLDAVTITLAGEGHGDLAGLRLAGIGELGPSGWSGAFDLSGDLSAGRLASRLQLSGPADAPWLAGPVAFHPAMAEFGRVEGTLSGGLAPTPAARFSGRVGPLAWLDGSSVAASARVSGDGLAVGVAGAGLFAEAIWHLASGLDPHRPARASVDLERELHVAGWTIGANGRLRSEGGATSGRLDLTGDLPGGPGLLVTASIAGLGDHLFVTARSVATPVQVEARATLGNTALTGDLDADLSARIDAFADLSALGLGPGTLRVTGPLNGVLIAPAGTLAAELETPGAPTLAGSLAMEPGGSRLILSGAGQSLGATFTWASGLAGATWTGSGADARPVLSRALPDLAGSATGRIDARADLADLAATLRVEGSLAGQLQASDLPVTIDPGSSFAYSPGRLHVPSASGQLLGGRFHVRGSVSATESLSVELRGLDPIGEPLTGPWSGTLTIGGPLDAVSLNLAAAGASGQRFDARAALTGTGLALEGEYRRPSPDIAIHAAGALTGRGLALELVGSRALSGSAGNITLTATGTVGGGATLRVTSLEAVPEVLWFDATGNLVFAGSSASPRIDADLDLAASLVGASWPRGQLTGTWTADRFTALLRGASFDISASQPPGEAVRFDAELRGVRWGDLEFTGRAAGRLDERGLSGDLDIRLDTPAGPGWLEGSGDGGEWRVYGRAEPAGGHVDLEATLSSGAWRGSLTATDLHPGDGLGPINLRALLEGPADAPRLTGRWTGRTLLFPAHGDLAVSLTGAELTAAVDLGGSEVLLHLESLWEQWPAVRGEVRAAAGTPVETAGRLSVSGPVTDPDLSGELRWRGPDESATIAVSGRLTDLEASGSLRRGEHTAEAILERRAGLLRLSATVLSPAGPSRLLVELGERGGEITARLTGLDLGVLFAELGGVVEATADLVVGPDGHPTGSATLRATGLDLPGLPYVEGADRLRGTAAGGWTGNAAGWSGDLELQTEPAGATLRARATGLDRAIEIDGRLRLPAGETTFAAGVAGGVWQAHADGTGAGITVLGATITMNTLRVRGERLDAEGAALGGRLTITVNGLSGLLPAPLLEWAGLPAREADVRFSALGVDIARLPGVAELALPVSGRIDLGGRVEGSAVILSGAGTGVSVGATDLPMALSGRVEGSRARGILNLGDSEFDLDLRASRLLVQGVMRGLPLDPLAQTLLGRPGVAVLATGALRAELLLDDLERSSGRLAVERLTVTSTGATLTGSGGVEYAERTWTVDNLALGGAGAVRASGRFAPEGFRVELDAEGDVLGPVVALLIGDELRPLDRGGRLALRASGTLGAPEGTLQATDLALALAGSEVTLRTLVASVTGGLVSARGEIVSSGLFGGEANLELTGRLAATPGLEFASARVGLGGWAHVPVVGRVSALQADAELAAGSWRVGARMEVGGTLTLQGTIAPAIDLTLSGRGIRLEDPDRFVQSGVGDVSLRLVEEDGVPVLRGALTLGELEVFIPALTAEPPGDEQPVVVDLDPDPTRAGPFAGLRFDNVRVTATRNVRFQSAPFSAEFASDLTLAGTAADPRVRGEVSVIRGSISLNQYRFNVDEGQIEFTPADGLYPSFRVRASGGARLPVERPSPLPPDETGQRPATLVTEPVSVRLAGSGRFVPAPDGGRRLESTFALTSDPPLALDPHVAEARLLSAILFGSVEGLDFTRLPGVVVDTLFEYLLVQQLEQRLAAVIGLDLFELRTDLLERIQRGDGETPGVQFTFGKYLSDQIFITYRLALGPDGTTQDLGAEFSVERALLRVSTELDFTAATLPWRISFGYLLDETTSLNLALGDRRGATTIQFGLQFRF
jgi:hypothetical protein